MAMMAGVIATGFIDEIPIRVYFFSTWPNIVGYHEGSNATVIHKRINKVDQLGNIHQVTWEGGDIIHTIRIEEELILDLTTVPDSDGLVVFDENPVEFESGISSFSLSEPVLISKVNHY